MARKFSKKITKKRIYKLTPKDAETIIKEEILTKYGNRIEKRFMFKPHSPEFPTIDFQVKADRKEAE